MATPRPPVATDALVIDLAISADLRHLPIVYTGIKKKGIVFLRNLGDIEEPPCLGIGLGRTMGLDPACAKGGLNRGAPINGDDSTTTDFRSLFVPPREEEFPVALQRANVLFDGELLRRAYGRYQPIRRHTCFICDADCRSPLTQKQNAVAGPQASTRVDEGQHYTLI